MKRRLRLPSLPRPGPNRGWLYRFSWWVARGFIWFVMISIGLVILFKWVPVPVTATMVMDPRGFEKDWTPLSRIDRNMVAAVIAGEDGKFCTHGGFDTEAMQKAWERNQRSKRVRGGSTISQQTAKNVFLWQGGGLFRKGLEAWFTVLIENIWGKRRIMEVYLNVAETGIGTYGVEAGAQRYYKHSAAKLSRIEAARIAAALPSPKKRDVVDPGGFTRRHGNTIAARTSVIKTSDYDGCVYD
ncbi:monofunctional biosynthetic peptidoglycan transglycosylase [Novosphingobium sp.]|uniref:monofunctional biosynthetic peptidoglycan transglycosylase n=1 Tax=Novosphingobium sp. TaxID=1874826 RepID=UPI00286D6EFA|nr:monofunctional biosynthetic peptidoglycan transglycosylase [Novosphingobium sp.]